MDIAAELAKRCKPPRKAQGTLFHAGPAWKGSKVREQSRKTIEQLSDELINSRVGPIEATFTQEELNRLNEIRNRLEDGNAE